jgi:hypothetical protein
LIEIGRMAYKKKNKKKIIILRLGEEHRLRAFENGMQRRIFGPESYKNEK